MQEDRLFPPNSKHSENTWRDQLWDYPDTISHAFKHSAPISYILASISVGLMIFIFTTSTLFARIVDEPFNGVWREGVLGRFETFVPLYVNQNPVDRDIHELLYNKLISIDQQGNPVPEVAESWNVDDDGNNITFKISDRYLWHDGEKLDAEDVVYTFQRAIDLAESDNFYGSVGQTFEDFEVRAVDTNSVEISVSELNSTFFESISIHIIPEHVYSEIDNSELRDYGKEFSIVIGSGPFKLERFEPAKIEFTANTDYQTDERGNIDELDYLVFSDFSKLQTAFQNFEIDGISTVADSSLDFVSQYRDFETNIVDLPLRKKTLYINLRQGPTAEQGIREAIAYAISQEDLIDDQDLNATPVLSTISNNSWAYNPELEKYEYDEEAFREAIEDAEYRIDENGRVLDEDGEQLSLSMVYLDNLFNEQIVTSMKEMLASKGILLETRPVTFEVFVNEYLSRRNFELLLFEIETTIDPDQYNLWHSLRVQYPDLNISGYEYSRVDIILERARTESNRVNRTEDYRLMQTYINRDLPVIPLYQPQLIYVHKNLKEDISFDDLVYPSDRFENIQTWKVTSE